MKKENIFAVNEMKAIDLTAVTTHLLINNENKIVAESNCINGNHGFDMNFWTVLCTANEYRKAVNQLQLAKTTLFGVWSQAKKEKLQPIPEGAYIVLDMMKGEVDDYFKFDGKVGIKISGFANQYHCTVEQLKDCCMHLSDFAGKQKHHDYFYATKTKLEPVNISNKSNYAYVIESECDFDFSELSGLNLFGFEFTKEQMLAAQCCEEQPKQRVKLSDMVIFDEKFAEEFEAEMLKPNMVDVIGGAVNASEYTWQQREAGECPAIGASYLDKQGQQCTYIGEQEGLLVGVVIGTSNLSVSNMAMCGPVKEKESDNLIEQTLKFWRVINYNCTMSDEQIKESKRFADYRQAIASGRVSVN